MSLTFNHKLVFNIKHKIKVCHKHLGVENGESLQKGERKYCSGFHCSCYLSLQKKRVS